MIKLPTSWLLKAHGLESCPDCRESWTQVVRTWIKRKGYNPRFYVAGVILKCSSGHRRQIYP